MLKQIHVQLYLPERPSQHGGIKKHRFSSGVFAVNFYKIPHLFLVFNSWMLAAFTNSDQSTDK